MQSIASPAASGSPPLIELRDVVKVYETANGGYPALLGISASINRGEFVGIVGKSGAGKSTLLNMISGVDRLTSGEVIVTPNGKSLPLQDMTELELTRFRGQTIGVVHQAFHFLPMLTILENVMLPMDLNGSFRRKESAERAMELLRLVEVDEHAAKKPTQISGGQQQRVAIARALANDPPILIADEPTGSLDSVTAEHVLDAFQRLIDQGRTIVMVTHDESLAPLFTRQLRLADGKLLSASGLAGGNGHVRGQE